MIEPYYSIVVARLNADDGGGYVAFVPDLHGCMSDGETPEEAFSNARQAIQEWIETAREVGRPVPEPGSAAKRATEQRAKLVHQLNEQKQAFEQLDVEIKSLRMRIESVSERLENDPVGWSPDSAVPAITTKQSRTEDSLH